MALEAGPAEFFDLNTLGLNLELPLPDEDLAIQVQGLEVIDTELASHQTAMGSAVDDLTQRTFNLHDDLNVAESALGVEIVPTVLPVPPELQAGVDDSDQGIVDAAAAIPVIPSPAPTLPPEYPPPQPEPHLPQGLLGN